MYAHHGPIGDIMSEIDHVGEVPLRVVCRGQFGSIRPTVAKTQVYGVAGANSLTCGQTNPPALLFATLRA
jgi:hypothetical protein